MKKMLTILLYFICSCCTKSICQECDGFSRNILTSITYPLCYKEDFKIYQNVYSSKCTVSILNGLDIYTVRFDYIKAVDSTIIKVLIVDEIKHLFLSKTIIKAKEHLSPMISNYNFNDTLISETGNYKILFTISDTTFTIPFISLNQFQSLDSSHVFYQINRIKKADLEKHLRIAKDNLDNIRISDSLHRDDSLRVVRLKGNASTWIKQLVSYKNEQINNILTEEKKVPPLPADIPSGNYFNNIVDSIFSNYNFNDSSILPRDFRSQHKFQCNSEGYLEEVLKTEITDGNWDSTWFNRICFSEIKEKMKGLLFQKKYSAKTHSVIPGLNSLADSILQQYSSSIKNIYFDTISPVQLKTKLLDTIAMIRMELERYTNRTFAIPTIYDYRLHFQIKKIPATWKVKKEKNGFITITPINAPPIEPITDCLRAKFLEQYHSTDTKTYNVYIQKVFINEKQTPNQCMLFRNQ